MALLADKRVSLEQLVQAIPDGAVVAVPAEYGGVAMAATFALIRRGAKGLRLVCAPTSSLQADILIGAGALAAIETAGVSLGEYGQANRFRAAVKDGSIALKDATCPALHAGFQAAEKGVPFLPLRGILGSDLLVHRPDWRVVQNPLAEGPDPIVLVPAIRPDAALFHAPLADAFGNVWVGVRCELSTLAHAATRTLVTAEEIFPDNLLDDPLRAPGTLPHLYVDAVAEVPNGSWPLAFRDTAADQAVLSRYAEASRTQAGFESLLAEWLHDH